MLSARPYELDTKNTVAVVKHFADKNRSSYITNKEHCLLSQALQINSITKKVCFLKHSSSIILKYTGKRWLLLIPLNNPLLWIWNSNFWMMLKNTFSKQKDIYTWSFVPHAALKCWEISLNFNQLLHIYLCICSLCYVYCFYCVYCLETGTHFLCW